MPANIESGRVDMGTDTEVDTAADRVDNHHNVPGGEDRSWGSLSVEYPPNTRQDGL